MKALMEKPFEYLKRKENNAFFEKDVVENWYKARAFVLEKLKDVAFEPTSSKHLHVVVDVDKDNKHLSPLMLSVVRQIALSAHYINFYEGDDYEAPRNRTVITIVSKNPHIRKELEKEEYLCNLLSYCKCVYGDSKTENENSYIDIEFHFVPTWSEKDSYYFEKETYRFAEKDVEEFCNMKKQQGEDIFSIDTRMASYASRMYELGTNFDNIPAEDIHCTARYSVAIDIFKYKKLRSRAQLFINKEEWDKKSICKIKESISNILCADCFKVREQSIKKPPRKKFEDEIKLREDEFKEKVERWEEKYHCKLKLWVVKSPGKLEVFWVRLKCGIKLWVVGLRSKKKLWAEYNESLSKSEHSRWVVEKLILGYRPLNDEERAHDEYLQMQGCGRNKDYRDMLKRRDKDPAHIDLCSYSELRRINPNDLKYDSFLMLAIPIVLHRVRKKWYSICNRSNVNKRQA
jgi:hypothetical protein